MILGANVGCTDYVHGQKCDMDLLITEDILTVLAMFDRELEQRHGTNSGRQPPKNANAVNVNKQQALIDEGLCFSFRLRLRLNLLTTLYSHVFSAAVLFQELGILISRNRQAVSKFSTPKFSK